jgi:hypothetical protein
MQVLARQTRTIAPLSQFALPEDSLFGHSQKQAATLEARPAREALKQLTEAALSRRLPDFRLGHRSTLDPPGNVRPLAPVFSASETEGEINQFAIRSC